MRGWYTTREIAELALPGVPNTRMGVAVVAERENWTSQTSPKGEPLTRSRSGRGGGLEYHVSLLPPQARAALSAAATKVDGLPSQAKAALAVVPAPERPERVLRRDARLMALTMADAHLRENTAMGRKAADADFADRFNAGSIEISPWIKEELPSLSATSLKRWRKARDSGNWNAVGGEGRATSSLLAEAEDGDVQLYIGGLLVKQPFLSSVQVRDLVEARFGAELRIGTTSEPLPHVRSFQRFITEWKENNRAVFMKLTDPDKFKSHMRFAGSNMYAGIDHVNQLWEIDASPADVMLRDGRHSIYLLIDIFSRRVRTFVSKTARTEAVQQLLRRTILGRKATGKVGHMTELPAWGVPEVLRTDNGSDFKSHAFTGSLLALGIEHHATDPFSPEQKASVERNIGTMQRFFALLPGFVGHSVADRKQIEGRKAFNVRLGETEKDLVEADLSRDELQDYLDRWAENKFAHEEHRGIGTTPFLKAQSSMGALRMIANPRAADLLLSPVAGGWRQVTKQGIRLDGAIYFSGALQPGTRVFCRQDPEDMGRLLVFEGEQGGFICEAICPERAGVDPRQAVAMAAAERNRIIKEGAEEYRAEARKIKPRDMIDDVLALAERKVPANLLTFPKRTEEHETDALAHAADAIENGAYRAVNTPFEEASTAVSNPPGGAASSNVVSLPETPKQRFSRAMALRDAKAKGLVIGDDDARWLGSYETTAEFKSHEGMYADWGSEWLNA